MKKNFEILRNNEVVESEYNGEDAMRVALSELHEWSESIEEGLTVPPAPHIQIRNAKWNTIEWDSRESECSHPEFKVISRECIAMQTLYEPAEYAIEVSCLCCGFVGDIEEVHCYAVER